MILIIFALLLLLGFPIYFVLFGTAFLYQVFFISQTSIALLLQRFVSSSQSFPLLAIPLFILAGNLMNISGISRRILTLCYILTARRQGGLAKINILLSTLLSGMSGSANGDAAMQAKVLVPEMVKKGYSPAFSSAVTAASSLIAPMIPPGIALIIFGFVAQVSIGKLFLGGVFPGLLMMAGQLIVTHFISKKRGYGAENVVYTPKEKFIAFINAFTAILMPLLIIGGIRFGIFTPTESAAIACVYALAIGLFNKEIRWRPLYEALLDTVKTTAVILLILISSSALSYVLTVEQIPQQFTQFLVNYVNNKYVFLFIVFFLLIILGMLLEGTANIIILAPLFMPIVRQFGIDPIQFGILMVFTVNMGGITPPVGTIMFTTCSITKVPLADFVKEIFPYLILLFVIACILIFIPHVSTFLAYF